MGSTRHWLAVAVAVALAVSVSSGAVWCVSADHAVLESAGEACCDRPDGPAPPAAGWSADGDGCGPCIDVAVAAVVSSPSIGPALAPEATAAHRDQPSPVGCAPLSSPSGRPGRLLDGTRLRL